MLNLSRRKKTVIPSATRRAPCPGSARRAVALVLLLATAGGGPAPAAPAATVAPATPLPTAVIGKLRLYTVGEWDTLHEIAAAESLGFVELAAANPGVDPWLPLAGTLLVLPTAHLLPDAPREGVVINLADQRLYFFPPGDAAPVSYPIGIGKAGDETPLGETRIVGKRADPVWYPPDSIRAENPDLPAAVPPGECNPLGSHAIDLAWSGYVVHGTNKPLGIGRRVSHGCIRLYPDDIAALFAAVRVGMPVRVVDQPVKLGWSAGELYLEVHPTQSQADEIERHGRFTPAPIADLSARIHRAVGIDSARLDWTIIESAARLRLGYPVQITR